MKYLASDVGPDTTNDLLEVVPAEPTRTRWSRVRGVARSRWFEAVAVVALVSVAICVVHPYGFLMRQPYWADESWVAVLSRAPLHQLIPLSSSTPIGWLLTVRWVPVGRDGLRLVPLSFSAASVVMAYVVARGLPWKTVLSARFAGALAALVVLLAPIALVRNDLKQYSSDAFFTLVVIALTSRFEGSGKRRDLVILVAGSLVAVIFSTAAVFIVVAVCAGLGLDALASRSLRRIRDVSIAVAVTLGPIAFYFVAVVLPHENPALRDYWLRSYLPEHGFAVFGEVWRRIGVLAPVLAMPALLFVVLLVVGSVFLAGFQRRALALAVPIVWAELIAAGVTQRYPVLDQRTSHFILVLSLTVIAIGVAAVITGTAARSRTLAVVLIVIAGGAFVHRASPYLRAHSIPNEDVRSQDAFVARQYQRGDTVLVNWSSDTGFTYYWPGGHMTYSVAKTGNGFSTRLNNLPNVVYAEQRTEAATTVSMGQAMVLSRAPASTGRIWVIRSHMNGAEKQAWNSTFSTLRLRPTRLRAGPKGLLLFETRPTSTDTLR